MDAPHPNHVASSLSSSALPSPGELANAVRCDPSSASGHVESLFLKGTAPGGGRALWIKYTLLVPRGAPERARAELWAVAFGGGSQPAPPRANKQSFPLSAARWSDAPFRLQLPCAELRHGYAAGELNAGGPRFRWQLSYACPEREFRPFASPRLYSGAFPRTKTLTPVPDSQLRGFFEVDGERWNVDGYAAAQGHNWGRGHAHAYAWAHCNAFDVEPGSEPCAQAWLEAISGRVQVGPWSTPWLSSAAICLDGTLYRFDGARALLSRSLRVTQTPAARSYTFELHQAGARLQARFSASDAQLAGLRYEDPDGRVLACLNSKLASARVTLSVRGRTWRLSSRCAALELGTRKTDHGVPILV